MSNTLSSISSTDDESAQWVRFTLKQLTHLAISARVVGSGALDAEGLLCDERLCRDLVRGTENLRSLPGDPMLLTMILML